MNRIFGLLFAAFLLPAAALAAEPPDALIGRVANEVLDKIRADTQLKSGDRVKISEFVNASLMPYVDFPRMTALAVGRNWRLASPEQQQTLMQEFRTLLVRTYSGAVSSVKDQKVRTKPLRAAAGDTDVVVRTEVIQAGREPIQLDYRLYKVGDSWKIYDVNVLGVWLVGTYRNQFAQQVSVGGIDGLIKSLVDMNGDAGKGGKS